MKIPFNIEAEMCVLGSIMGEPDNMIDIVDILTADHFYNDKHQKIYKCMLDLFSRGKGVDMVTVASDLNGDIEKIGGYTYLTSLVTDTPTMSNSLHYAETVKESYQLRETIKACQNTIAETDKTSVKSENVIGLLQDKLFGITEHVTSDGTQSAKEITINAQKEVDDLMKNKGKLPGIKTTFKQLDRTIMGLNKSDLIILAARPAVGKSAFATNLLYHVARQNKKVLLFSLEMSSKQVADRIIASAGNIPLMNIKLGTLNPEQHKNYIASNGNLHDMPWWVNDNADMSMAQIRAASKKQKIKNGLDLVIIDYLQLINGASSGENRQNQISAISRSLKILAKELEIPVIALSQLSRACETRGGKPMLSDLRDSGAIEQDADIVMFLHKPKVLNGQREIVELIVSKNRNGETKLIPFGWTGSTTRFGEIDYYGDY